MTSGQPVPDASDAVALETPPATNEQSTSSGQAPGSAQTTKGRQSGLDLEKRLLKLKDLYDKGLISEAVYEAKQKEFPDRMFDD